MVTLLAHDPVIVLHVALLCMVGTCFSRRTACCTIVVVVIVNLVNVCGMNECWPGQRPYKCHITWMWHGQHVVSCPIIYAYVQHMALVIVSTCAGYGTACGMWFAHMESVLLQLA